MAASREEGVVTKLVARPFGNKALDRTALSKRALEIVPCLRTRTLRQRAPLVGNTVGELRAAVGQAVNVASMGESFDRVGSGSPYLPLLRLTSACFAGSRDDAVECDKSICECHGEPGPMNAGKSSPFEKG